MGDFYIPLWFNISIHGGIHLIIVREFFNNDIIIQHKDVRGPFLIAILYLLCIAVPLKYFGIIIYPLFFDEILPTIVIIIGGFTVVYLSFLSGYYLINKKKNA